MKNFQDKMEQAGAVQLEKAGRKQRRFVAAVTRKIVDSKIIEKNLPTNP